MGRTHVREPRGSAAKGSHDVRGVETLPAETVSAQPAGVRDALMLQRAVGNRAAVSVEESTPPAVQRALTTASAFAKEGGLGAMSALAGKGAFADIFGTLKDYEKAKKSQGKLALLAKLDALCSGYVQSHRAGDARDVARTKTVQRLLDEIAEERKRVGQAAAEEEYTGGLKASTPGKASGAAHVFNLLTPGGKKAADQSIGATHEKPAAKAFREDNGLTDAEVAAIRIFSAADYTYMNPVTAGDKSSFDYNRLKTGLEADPAAKQRAAARQGGAPGGKSVAPDVMKEASEEGSLHSAMAIKGLEKIKPYDGEVFRGERHSEAVFQKLFQVGQIQPRNSLMSTTKKRNVAENFAHGISSEQLIDASKTVAVIITITSTSGRGREISALSEVPSEGEVVVLPGTKLKTTKVEEVADGAKTFQRVVAMSQQRKPPQPLPTKWYEVTLEPVVEGAEQELAVPDKMPPLPPVPPPRDAGADLTPPKQMPPLPATPTSRGRLQPGGHRRS